MFARDYDRLAEEGLERVLYPAETRPIYRMEVIDRLSNTTSPFAVMSPLGLFGNTIA